MGKHLGIKAFVLLIVIFFHSFVLVPKASAVSMGVVIDIAVARQAFLKLAPAVVSATPAYWGYAIAFTMAWGIGYYLIKSAGVTGLKDWLTSSGVLNAPYIPTGSAAGQWWGPKGGRDRQWLVRSNPLNAFPLNLYWSTASYQGGATQFGGSVPDQQHLDDLLNGVNGPGSPLPSTPQDYAAALAGSQPSYPPDSVFFTPGAAAGIGQGSTPISAVSMPDADLDRMKVALGATMPDSSGAQPNYPAQNDNTMTAGNVAQLGALGKIAAFVSNLLGIKLGIDNLVGNTAAQKFVLDNIAGSTVAQKATLDNIAALTQAQKPTFDNIAVGVANQTALQTAANAKLDNATAALRSIDNVVAGLSTSTATPSTLSSRIASLQSVLSTKFPFSLAGSLSVSAVAGESTYVFTSLQLAPGIEVPIDPMAGPLGSLLTWARQMVVYLFWVGTLLAILHRGMSM